MEAKKAAAEMARRSKIEQEKLEINSNQAALAVNKERQAKERNDVKQFWQSQLQETEQQKR